MVSVIIPTFNRFDQLNRTLSALIRLKTDVLLFEIIVIDNGSTDSTKDVVQDYINSNKLISIYYYYDAEPGLLTGRHLGAKLAKGDILTFIDDDVQVSETWLDTIIEVMQNKPKVVFLTGPNLPKYESIPPLWLNYFWKKNKNEKYCSWLSLLDFGDKIQKIHPNFVWGLNFTIRKNAFIELGGFHPDCIPKKLQHFQGDGETGLTKKGFEKGYIALYHPKVKLFHEVPSSRLTFEYFEERAYYQGVGNSFSELRLQNRLYKTVNEIQIIKKSNSIKLINKFKLILFYFGFLKNNSIPIEIENLKKRFSQKEKEGFQFHQNMFRENNEVKNWVLKQDYFNYKLPNHD